MHIAKNSVVTMHYEVATSDGEPVDRSSPEHPLTYLHGHGNLIPGLEAVLAGKAKGDKIATEVLPEQAYGEHDPGLDLVVPTNAFPADAQPNLKPGFRFQAEHPGRPGEDLVFTVIKVEGDEVYVSGNHVLAGKTLNFKVEIVDVRAASGEEIAHGHVHGAGGHHH